MKTENLTKLKEKIKQQQIKLNELTFFLSSLDTLVLDIASVELIHSDSPRKAQWEDFRLIIHIYDNETLKVIINKFDKIFNVIYVATSQDGNETYLIVKYASIAIQVIIISTTPA